MFWLQINTNLSETSIRCSACKPGTSITKLTERKTRKPLLLQLCLFDALILWSERRYLPVQNPRTDPCLGSWWFSLCKTASLNFVARLDDIFGLMKDLSWANLLHALPNGTQAPNHLPLPFSYLWTDWAPFQLMCLRTSFRGKKISPVYLFCFCKLYCVPHRAEITKFWAVPSSPLCYLSRVRCHYPSLSSSGFLLTLCLDTHRLPAPRLLSVGSHCIHLAGTCTAVLSDLCMLNCLTFSQSPLPLVSEKFL